jgi:hypothetical protein
MAIELLGKEVRFLVPSLRNSDRQPHDPSEWAWLEIEMYNLFTEGWQMRHFSRNESGVLGSVQGHWFDKEKNEGVPDTCIEYVVAIMTDRMPVLFQLFETLCERFDQKCIYFSSGGDAALFHPTNHQG